MKSHDVTIVAGGLKSRRARDSKEIRREAIAIFDPWVGGTPPYDIDRAIPVDGLRHLRLRLSAETRSAALATIWTEEELATTSILLSGVDPADDATCLAEMQAMIVQIYGGTEMEPGFDLATIVDRPLLATLVHSNPHRAVLRDLGRYIADMENCRAAAFFKVACRRK